MANDHSLKGAINKLFKLINLEKTEIKSIYIFALINAAILLSIPLGIQAIINLMFGVTVSTSLVVLIGLVISGVLINGFFQIQQMRVIESLQQRIFTRLTFAYAYIIPKLKLSSIDKYYLPELVNRFFDTASLQKGLSKILLDLPTATIQVLFGLILLGFYHPIFIIFGIVLVLLGIIIFHQSSSKGFESSIKESDFKYRVASWLEELSRSIKTFKFNQNTDLHLKRTDELVTGYLSSRDEHFKVLLFQYRVIIGFKVIITATMLVVGAYLFLNQLINLGQFIATEIIIITIINALEKLIVSLELVYDVLTSLEKINKVLDNPQDKEDELLNANNWEFTSSIDIAIKNLSFGYDNTNLVLKDINLEIAKGQKICIKGFENSGKSTLLKVLSGMITGFEGQFLLNQQPIQNISPEILHQEIAFHLTEDELFAGTLLENITIGNSSVDYNELQQIITLVGLKEFISNKKDGLKTMLDPQGKRLSYNVAQKILLARCIFKKASLFLIDESWMNIDLETKTRITDYLTSSQNAATLVAITNDDYFASKCDKVCLMENGYII